MSFFLFAERAKKKNIACQPIRVDHGLVRHCFSGIPLSGILEKTGTFSARSAPLR
ncbi:hypothetical protein D3OALGA1CA_3723 [Olavius algarvensis associated proteobacterium Delta 3]|nr:hypothetical protein D3OALGA1CA_3723 [Olavius algarvensis associated proteobacterium Delta 3]CAB5148955.1 hypothetical protein D3OALGB2SA_4684 [Olavius algarvensis associated proteobacterium Delta 3]